MAEREMKKKNQYEHLIRTMAARITNLESGAATADGGNWLHGYQTSSTSATTTTKTIQIDTTNNNGGSSNKTLMKASMEHVQRC